MRTLRRFAIKVRNVGSYLSYGSVKSLVTLKAIEQLGFLARHQAFCKIGAQLFFGKSAANKHECAAEFVIHF